jgi:hypothetical protein
MMSGIEDTESGTAKPIPYVLKKSGEGQARFKKDILMNTQHGAALSLALCSIA